MVDPLARQTYVNRGSVSNPAPNDCDSAIISSSGDNMPCEEVKPLLHSSPGSSQVRVTASNSVRVVPSGPSKRDNRPTVSVIIPLPYFGIDRMGDFGQVGTASLWKSGPFFSTGTNWHGAHGHGVPVEPAVAVDAMPGRLRGRESGKRMEWSWPQVVHSICRAQAVIVHRYGGVSTEALTP
jgi:hypothetical protein